MSWVSLLDNSTLTPIPGKIKSLSKHIMTLATQKQDAVSPVRQDPQEWGERLVNHRHRELELFFDDSLIN